MMEKVEFTMNPTFNDFSKSALSKLWSNRGFHVYLVILAFILLGCIIWYNHGPAYGKGAAEMVGFLTFLGLITPFFFFLGVARRDYKSRSTSFKDFRYIVDKDGFGWKSPSMEVTLSWQEARSIFETQEFLFIWLKRGGSFTIFKKRVSPDVVTSVREIVNNAPVEDKRMLEQSP